MNQDNNQDHCVCGHLREEHWIITDKSCTRCDCSSYKQADAFGIRTILDTDGVSRVAIEFGSTKLQLTADAAVHIALNLLSAAYAARSELAIFEYAQTHDIDVTELLKIVR